MSPPLQLACAGPEEDLVVSVYAVLDYHQDPGQIEDRLSQEQTKRWSR